MGSVDTGEIQVIELHMMDKRKYLPLTVVSGCIVRGLLYPFGLVKTRLQVQRSRTVYHGTFDAFLKITKSEGVRGLYRGFLVSNLFVFPQVVYIGTYETVRQVLAENTPAQDQRLRSFVAGGCASLASQTLVVPIDIVTQHLQMWGQGHSRLDVGVSKSSVPVNSKALHTNAQIKPSTVTPADGSFAAVVSAVYRQGQLRGFFKGYVASIWVYAPNSALWWFFYDIYCGTSFLLLLFRVMVSAGMVDVDVDVLMYV